MKTLLSVIALAACGSAQHAAPGEPATDDFASAFVHASQTGDVAAVRHMLGPSVVVAGVWFSDPKCTGQFAGPLEVSGGRLDELARCLATLKFQRSPHEEQLVDVFALTYDPGFEVEARFLDTEKGAYLVSIGYEARRDRADALPTVSPETLETLRAAGTATPAVTGVDDDIAKLPFHHAYTWMKVCIDTDGNVTGAHVRETSSPHAARAFTAAIQDWKFRPFTINGKALPVCALEALEAPAVTERTHIPMPEPIVGPPDTAVVASQALHRTSGATALAPSDHVKTAIQRARVSTLIGSFQYCLAATGKVDSVDLIRSTGVPDYDAMIMSGIRAWQYDPYLDDGKPVPVCSSVTFHYDQRPRR